MIPKEQRSRERFTPPNMSKCTPELIEALFQARADGLGFSEAARAAGIAPRTLREYRQKGQMDPDSIFGTLVKRLEEAGPEFERTNLRTIAEASKKSWQAAAWLLERTRPEKYALIKRVETGPPGAFDNLNDAELSAAILELVPKRHPKRKAEDGEPEDG